MGELKYDIRELRIRPGQPTKWYQEQEQEAERTRALASNAQQQETLGNAPQEWLNYKNMLGEALRKIYPLSKKQTSPEEPERVTKLENGEPRKKYAW